MVRFRNFIVLILAPVLLQGLFGQQQYLDVEDIKEEPIESIKDLFNIKG